jgi:hypothetical protein
MWEVGLTGRLRMLEWRYVYPWSQMVFKASSRNRGCLNKRSEVVEAVKRDNWSSLNLSVTELVPTDSFILNMASTTFGNLQHSKFRRHGPKAGRERLRVRTGISLSLASSKYGQCNTLHLKPIYQVTYICYNVLRLCIMFTILLMHHLPAREWVSASELSTRPNLCNYRVCVWVWVWRKWMDSHSAQPIAVLIRRP